MAEEAMIPLSNGYVERNEKSRSNEDEYFEEDWNTKICQINGFLLETFLDELYLEIKIFNLKIKKKNVDSVKYKHKLYSIFNQLFSYK